MTYSRPRRLSSSTFVGTVGKLFTFFCHALFCVVAAERLGCKPGSSGGKSDIEEEESQQKRYVEILACDPL